MNKLKHLLRALRYRNYRLFFFGQGTSLIGTWTQSTAMSWLIYRLTGSAFLLGVISFLSQIPVFIVAPFGGVLADRFNLRRIQIYTQVLSTVQALVLTILVLTDKIAVWHILVLTVFLGIVNSIDMPSRQAFTVKLVDNKGDLGNAIALNSMMFNIARLIGPSIAGIIIAAAGEGICFMINTISFLAAIFALLSMRITFVKKDKVTEHVLKGLKEGLRYAFSSGLIKNIILLLALVNLTCIPFGVFMPVFAKDILHGNARTLGFLTTSIGAGALMGASYLASKKSTHGLLKLIPFSAGMLGLTVILFAFSRSLPLSLFLMVIAGLCMIGQNVTSNTMLQTIVADDKRGRVMSLFTTALVGIAPFGSLLAGTAASRIGAPYTLIIGGILCIIGTLILSKAFRKKENLNITNLTTDAH